jgi:CRP-like cAMP-binding protein
VFVANRAGVEHSVGRVAPGATLGEMSLFTGQPAVGTVRAVTDLDVLVMTEADLIG